MKDDKLIIGGHEFTSRFILGSGKYSHTLIEAAINHAGAEIITLALRRVEDGDNILDYIPKGITLLPNTSGCATAEEAVRICLLYTSKSACLWQFFEAVPPAPPAFYPALPLPGASWSGRRSADFQSQGRQFPAQFP